MPVTNMYPHSCGFSKKPCNCILKLGKDAYSKKNSIIIPNFADDHPISEEDRRGEFWGYGLPNAVTSNSPIASIDGNFIVQGNWNSSCPPKRTALHFTCNNCGKIWCYTSETALRQEFTKDKLPNAFAFFTDEFDKLLEYLSVQTTRGSLERH